MTLPTGKPQRLPMGLPAAKPAEKTNDIIHVYQLVSGTGGHKYHALCFPHNGARPITTYGDDVDVIVRRAQKLIDVGNEAHKKTEG